MTTKTAATANDGFRLAALTLVLMWGSVPALAQLQDENVVRAAFVYNLTKYVQWPQPSAELVIAFIGDGPMGTVLKKSLEGKSSDTGPIRVVVSPSEAELQTCRVLYVAYSSRKQVRAVLDKVANRGVLSVGDSESFTEEGGVVGLLRSGNQIQIVINQDAALQSQLKISSRLLSLATIVRSARGGKG